MAAAVAMLLAALVSTAFSQGGGNLTPAPSSDPGTQSGVNRLDMSEREFAMRNRQAGGNRLVLESQRKLLYSQIKEDFERIQELNKELVNTIAVRTSPAYRQVSELSTEIKKRASRLKLNLGLPDAEDAGRKQKSRERGDPLQSLDKSIVMLDHSVISFVSNALFKQGPDVINAQHVTKASLDLNSIIELSDGLRKSASQLDKSKK